MDMGHEYLEQAEEDSPDDEQAVTKVGSSSNSPSAAVPFMFVPGQVGQVS